MPKILHLLEHLDASNNTRAIISASLWSSRLNKYDHLFIILGDINPQAAVWAKEAGITLIPNPEKSALNEHLESADIVQIEYGNTPAINHILRQSLPPARLAIWSHVPGLLAPKIFPGAAAIMADVCITSVAGSTGLHHAVTSGAVDEGEQLCTIILPPADFKRLAEFEPAHHDGFNVGFIGESDLADVDPAFISMCAEVELSDVQFIFYGKDAGQKLSQQAVALNATDRFVFHEEEEGIAGMLETLDVFGCPPGQAAATTQLYLQMAMFAGIPVVVFDTEGNRGLIKHNETGLIVCSPEDYLRTLTFLYNNPAERKRIGLNASIFARTYLGAQNAGRDFDRVYAALLNIPKRNHAWGYSPFDQASLQMPDVIPTAAQQFVEALNGEASAFEISLHESDVLRLIAAEKSIAASAEIFSEHIKNYTLHAPSDPHLHLWAGLCFDNQGDSGEAVGAFAAAIELGLNAWRVQWYLARALYNLNKVEESRRIYASLRLSIPEFDKLTGDVLFVEPERKVIEFSIHSNKVLDAPSDLEGVVQQDEVEEVSPVKVSAIVSTYASAAFIDGCLHNLVAQSLFQKGEMEIIVIDAHSPENEKEIVARYQEHFDNIRYVRTPARETLYASWNRGIKMAKGDYITSANTDDRHRRDALELMARYLDAHPEFALIYPGQKDTSAPNESFETTTSNKVLNWPAYTHAELERHCIIGSQPVWRRSMHDKYGYFREEFISAGDYEFWLRMGRHEAFFRYPETLGLYFRNPAGIEHSAEASERETLQIWQEYGMFERGIPVILNGRVIQQARTPQFTQPALTQPALTKPALTQPVNTPLPARPPFDKYITQFESALYENNFDHALSVAESAVMDYGELPYPMILKAIALRQKLQYSAALAALEHSIKIDETPEALVELYQLSMVSGQKDEAERTYAYIEQKYPEWRKRVETLNKSILKDDTAYATGPANLNDLDYSISSFANLKTQFAQLLHHKELDRAEALAKAAILKFPENHEAWVLKATTDRINGSFQDAREAIQKSLLIEDSPEALIELFEVSRALGDKEEARNIATMFDTVYPNYSSRFRELFPEVQM